MSFAYATLEEAKRQVNVVVSDTYHDAYLTQLIFAASAAVKNHLGDKSAYQADLNDDDEPAAFDSNWEPLLESFDSATKSESVRYEVKQAVLFLVGEWFRNRDGNGANYGPNGELPKPVVALLAPLRDPALQ